MAGTSSATRTRDGAGPVEGPVLLWRGAVVIAAGAAAFIVWGIAVLVAGLDLVVRPMGLVMEVGPGPVVALAILGGLGGWVSLALLERVARRPLTTWLRLAAVVLVLSLAGPLTSGAAVPVIAVLVAIHVVVAGVVVGGMVRRVPASKAAR